MCIRDRCYNSKPTGRDNLEVPIDYFKKRNMQPASIEASLLKIEIRNSNAVQIKVRLTIKEETKLNFMGPKSLLANIVDPNMWLIAYLGAKTELWKPFGDFEIDWYVQFNGENEEAQEGNEAVPCNVCN
eukprot:TRINITY_DN6049_c0_g1_i8.p1 TRINITY_DN6049_c0_g1~~TRINITY_DN6049_c0_g1_i8.p1  ORF type:complete len:144 (+),score=28.48 TRINITY_DN6049_c0_g1_i8:48-434(+)